MVHLLCLQESHRSVRIVPRNQPKPDMERLEHMNREVRVLSREVVSKIAAGEVVERPFSVVKELVENSIDAGAAKIQCELAFGGKELIRVADDGWGMSEPSVLLAVERHSTSKISQLDDLNRVETLGFRGEALPSIAQVSRLELTTRSEGDPTGTYLLMEEGEVKAKREAGRSVGTTVAAHNLFYNLPARRKFLRSEATELRRILGEIKTQALARPRISFSVSHNGQALITLPGVKTHEERMYELFGKDLLNSMVPVKNSRSGTELWGYVVLPQAARPTRALQYVFLNSRYIRDRMISHAVYEGYGGHLGGKYPAFILFLKVDPRTVDVNVHPTKREVKFRDESRIHSLVADSVKRALKSAVSFERPSKPYRLPTEKLREWAREPPGSYAGEELELNLVEQTLSPVEPSKELFWQLHNTYILAQTKEGVLVVDQHAAHERILFNQVTKKKGALPQQLLFPINLNLTPSEHLILEQYLPSLSELGFRIKKFSGRTVVVEAVPSCMKKVNEETVRSLLEEFGTLRGGREVSFEDVSKVFACKAAIKAGQSLKPEEMNSLIDRLFATDFPYLCPHGRPTMIKLPLDELERRLGRR